MSSPSVTPSTQYDIIFAGGGPCACIAASRLAEVDPSLKILIIEYGSHVRNEPRHVQPAQYMRLLADPGLFHHHVGKPSLVLGGRSPVVAAPKAVGGGSVLNYMIYSRAAASDYDDWERIYGNRGWGSDSLIPLLKEAETYQEQDTNGTHGFSGPIKISYAPNITQVGSDFLEAAKKYDKSRTMSDDLNAFYECDKYGRWARYIDKTTGKRSDVPHHYIYNQEENPNFVILSNHLVDSIIIEEDRAVGVRYESVLHPELGGKEARASKFVILGAGAFGSPAILERSGIGSSKVLEPLNIRPIVNLPGVGDNYMDHMVLFPPYRGAKEIESLDEIIYGTEEQFEHYTKLWLETGQGLMAHNALDAGVKLRPRPDEIAKMTVDMQARWKSYYEDVPDRPLLLLGPMAALIGAPPSSFEEKYFCVGFFPGHLASSGYTHVSDKNPRAPLDLHPGYLDHPADLDVMKWGYKKSRELARRMDCYRGEISWGHPPFAKDSRAAVIQCDTPHSANEADIAYSEEDDACIEEFMRERASTAFHSCGTCAMKPRAQGGVVDERLNVYDIHGLKVADCSIFPGNVAANTYNTAIAIGEKAAIIIAEDLKLGSYRP